MAPEKRITPEMAAQARAEITKALDSTSKSSKVNVLGTELELEKDPDGQISISSPDRSVQSRVFPPTAARPEGYPAGIPFLADEPAIGRQTEADFWSIIWMALKDPPGAFQSLIEQLLSNGWTRGAEEHFPHIPAKHQKMHRDAATCEILLSGNIVSLFIDAE